MISVRFQKQYQMRESTMIRILMIYLAVATFALFAHAEGESQMQGQVVYEQMKPIKADGKDVPPIIVDYTKKDDSSVAENSAGLANHRNHRLKGRL